MSSRRPYPDPDPDREQEEEFDEAPGRAGAQRRSSGGPALLFVPLFAFVLVLCWLAFARPRHDVRVDPPPAAVDTVAGWTGASAEGTAPRVAARLTRLHAEPIRQAFERAALARRLGLGEGEPFRLELHAGLAGADGALPLAQLAIHDDLGLACAPLPHSAPVADDAVADPLAILLELPDALAPGVTAGLVLWGRAPGEGARLVGLDGGELALEPRTLAWRGIDEALASLERVPTPELEVAQPADPLPNDESAREEGDDER